MIDEVHTLIGAGAAEGAIDAANILKPALARGELQCIGATTLDEYRKHIEKDPALERCAAGLLRAVQFRIACICRAAASR
jgi:ATP-dependent Clp protease ATP-binding subunit ClpC